MPHAIQEIGDAVCNLKFTAQLLLYQSTNMWHMYIAENTVISVMFLLAHLYRCTLQVKCRL